MENAPKFLRRKDAADYLKSCYGVGARRTLDKLATVGGGPPFTKIGGAACYAIADLDAWVESRSVAKHATNAPVYNSRSMAGPKDNAAVAKLSETTASASPKSK